MDHTLFLADSLHAHKLPSPQEMAAFDAATIKGGVPSLELMERAGEAIFMELKAQFSFELYSHGKITILCGSGNNGGDGLVIARHLRQHGYDLAVIIIASKRYTEENIHQAKEYVSTGGALHLFPEGTGEAFGLELPLVSLEELRATLGQSIVVVDSLLGTGQKEPPRGTVRQVIECLNEVCTGKDNPPRVLAVDIPTGINADTGEVYVPAVRADMTVSVELVKRGMVQYPARNYCGTIVAVPIGIECAGACEFSLVDRAVVEPLPPRSAEAHKGDFGHVLVVGGSAHMPGAPFLSGSSALRSGAGLVTVTQLANAALPSFPAELMLRRIEGTEGFLAETCLEQIKDKIRESKCVVIGPGLGMHIQTGKLVDRLIDECRKQGKIAVIDADGLNLLSSVLNDGQTKLNHCVLTPHPGEMGRLLRIETSEVQRDRYTAARKLAELTGAVVVLKGASTLVYHGGVGYVNTSGNPYMATAGSGDVLAGMIAALIAQGIRPLDAARRAVYLHGVAGDMAHARLKAPLIASDIIAAIPQALGNYGSTPEQ